MLDGGFCLPCVICARAIRGCDNLGTLVTRPMRSFYKGTEISRKHSDAQYHKNAVADMVAFQHRMENQSSVNILASSAHSRQIRLNHMKLLSTAKCILLCGRQNIPLRGHVQR